MAPVNACRLPLGQFVAIAVPRKTPSPPHSHIWSGDVLYPSRHTACCLQTLCFFYWYSSDAKLFRRLWQGENNPVAMTASGTVDLGGVTAAFPGQSPRPSICHNRGTVSAPWWGGWLMAAPLAFRTASSDSGVSRHNATQKCVLFLLFCRDGKPPGIDPWTCP